MGVAWQPVSVECQCQMAGGLPAARCSSVLVTQPCSVMGMAGLTRFCKPVSYSK